jgi:hypothetical protein
MYETASVTSMSMEKSYTHQEIVSALPSDAIPKDSFLLIQIFPGSG